MEPKEKEKQNLTENRTKRNQRQKLIVAILLKFVNKFGHIFFGTTLSSFELLKWLAVFNSMCGVRDF